MKFQHLILPSILWFFVGTCMTFFVPTSPLVIGIIVVLISLATYFSLRVVCRSKLPLIGACCVSLFLLASVFSGFSLINLLLIGAIGTLIMVLIK